MDKLVDNIYDRIKAKYHIFEDRKVDLAEVVDIIGAIMEIVEAFKATDGPLNGTQKKDIVIDVMARLADDLPMDSTKRVIVNSFVDYILPFVIDKIIQASKGELDINKKIEEAKKASSWCCGLICRK
jgi:hypothetical protein